MDSRAIVNRIIESKIPKIKIYPQYVTRASEIGHPCERYLVYSVTNWADRKPHAPEVEFIFEGGRAVEELAIKDLEGAGFKVYRPEPDKAIMESRPRITGHIDIRVDFGDGQVYTGEIKGLNSIDFDRLNTVEDFFKSKKPWIKKYPAQLMTYLYIKGEEEGFFYLKSIPRFQPKIIPVKLDLEYMESILQKTERVEKHIKEGTFPDQIDDPDTCENCAFNHVCLPNINREGIEFIVDEEFIDLLQRREELKPLAHEFDEVDKQVKDKLSKKERVLAGDYLIKGSMVTRKASVIKESTYMKYKIININKASKIVN
jgi:CRISPR/Cas system-associated exonuclease Cas4 (RecB family)